MSIAQLLRESSRPQHTQAENTTFITQLMRGQLNMDAYAKYLTNLAWLYEALEAKVSEGKAFESSEPIWDSRLNRLASIDSDLAALGLVDWRTSTKPSTAMVSYIEHINSLDGRADHRLVAHHYTRYLGDLSGGQAIAALVSRNYGAKPEQLTFYNFTEIKDLVRYKEGYRAALDGLMISAKQIDELVREVQIAFEFNQRVFEDLVE